MVAPAGIEPATQGFSVPCSTDWAMKPYMAVSTGLEPAIFCVTGRRVNQLHHETILVAGEGFEPSTFGLWAQRATELLHPAIFIGGGKGIRTPASLARPPGFQDRSLQPDLGIPPIHLYFRRQIDYIIVILYMSTNFMYFFIILTCKKSITMKFIFSFEPFLLLYSLFLYYYNKTSYKSSSYYTDWCLRPDLNRHEGWFSQDFKSCASTNSATQALVTCMRFELMTLWLKVKCSTNWANRS